VASGASRALIRESRSQAWAKAWRTFRLLKGFALVLKKT